MLCIHWTMATAPQRFSEFLAFLESTLTEEMRGIMPLVMKRYNACSRPFKNSVDMLNLLTSTKQEMENDQRHMFIYLKGFLTKLTEYQEKEKLLNASKRKRESDEGVSDGSNNNSESESGKASIKKRKVSPETKSSTKPTDSCIERANSDTVNSHHSNTHNIPNPGYKQQMTATTYKTSCKLTSDEVYISLSSSDEDSADDNIEDNSDKFKGNLNATPKSLSSVSVSSSSKPVNALKNSFVSLLKLTDVNYRKTYKDTNQNTSSEAHCSSHVDGQDDLDQVEIKEHSQNNNGEKPVSEKHVLKLEKLLRKLRNEIEKTREKELDMDDLQAENSAYIYEDRLEKKFVAAWNKLCQLKKRTTTTGRPAERRFTYNGSRYPEVNKRIKRLVNKKKIFPDYFDIRKIFRKVNEQKSLNLSNGVIESLARETFTDVGNLLQQRRHDDFICTFRCRQTEGYRMDKDPALFDIELKQKLEENRQAGKIKLEDVINKFAEQGYKTADKKEETSSLDLLQDSCDETENALLNSQKESDIEEEPPLPTIITPKKFLQKHNETHTSSCDCKKCLRTADSRRPPLSFDSDIKEDTIQPRSTDPNIWPVPTKVKSKDESSDFEIEEVKLHSGQEDKNGSALDKVETADVHNDDSIMAEGSLSCPDISSSSEVIVLDLADDGIDAKLKPNENSNVSVDHSQANCKGGEKTELTTKYANEIKAEPNFKSRTSQGHFINIRNIGENHSVEKVTLEHISKKHPIVCNLLTCQMNGNEGHSDLIKPEKVKTISNETLKPLTIKITNNFTDPSPTSSLSSSSSTLLFNKNIPLVSKRRIQLQVPKSFLKTDSQNGDNEIVKVETQFVVSNIKHQNLSNSLTSTTKNISRGRNHNEDCRTVTMSGNVNESDDDVIILSD